MAQTSNMIQSMWWTPPVRHKRARAGTLAAGVRIYQGALCIAVDGVARPAVSGATLLGLGLLHPGADPNGGLYFRASRPQVRVQLISGAAEGVAITEGATTDVAITYNNGTSTAATMVKFLRGHADVRKLLPGIAAQGTGASSPAAQNATAVPHIEVLGPSSREYDNSGGANPLALAKDEVFPLGAYGMLPASNNAPAVEGVAHIVDDEVVTKVSSLFDLRGRVVGSHGGLYFLDLETVE